MIITISRTDRKRGHVGRLLAEKLGYEFYDKKNRASVQGNHGIDGNDSGKWENMSIRIIST